MVMNMEVDLLLAELREVFWVVALLVVFGIIARILYPPIAIVFWVLLGIFILYKVLQWGEKLFKAPATKKGVSRSILLGDIELREKKKMEIKIEYIILIVVLLVALIVGLYVSFHEASVIWQTIQKGM